MESYRTRLKDKLEDGVQFLAEALVFLPFDMLTVRIRDKVIPRSLKKRFPALACRGYAFSYSESPFCRASQKYTHRKLFRIVCGHYNEEDFTCQKYCEREGRCGLARSCVGRR